MKLSNNALNFLLAQYRAIFKRAYIAGLAPAIMLTAALAAGSAQAAITPAFDTDYTAGTTSPDVVISGAGNTIATGSKGYADDITLENGASLAVSGTASHTGILSVGSGSTLTVTGSINGNNIYTSGSGKPSNSADWTGSMQVSGGTVKVSGQMQTGEIAMSSATVVIGKDSGVRAHNQGAYLIGGFGDGQNDVNVAVDSTITFNEYGFLQSNDRLIVKDSTLDFNGAKPGDEQQTTNEVENFETAFIRGRDGVELYNTEIKVADNKKGGIYGPTTTISGGSLTIGTSSEFVFDGDWNGFNDITNGSGTYSHAAGQLTLSEVAIVNNKGSLTIGGYDHLTDLTLSGGSMQNTGSVSIYADSLNLTESYFNGLFGDGSSSAQGKLTFGGSAISVDGTVDLNELGILKEDGTLTDNFVIEGAQTVTLAASTINLDSAYKAGNLSLDAGTLNFSGAASSSKRYTSFTISSGSITVHDVLNGAAETDRVVIKAESAGNTAKLHLAAGANGGKVTNVDRFNVGWSSKAEGTSKLEVDGTWDFGDARITASSNAQVTIDGTANNVSDLMMESNGHVTVNGAMTIERLLGAEEGTTGTIDLNGSLTITGNGDLTDEGSNPPNNVYFNDVQLPLATVNINNGGTLAITGEDALEDIFSVTKDTDGKVTGISVVTEGSKTEPHGGWDKRKVNLNAGGTLSISVADIGLTSISTEDLKTLKNSLVNDNYQGAFNFGTGLTIKLGEELQTDIDDGEVDYSVLKDAGINDVQNVAEGVRVVVDASTATAGINLGNNAGAVKLEGNTDNLKVTGSLILTNTDGDFVYNEDGELAGVTLSNNASANFTGTGNIGPLTKDASATGTSVNLTSTGSNGLNVQGDIDLDNVNVNGGTVNVSGSVTANELTVDGILNVAQGSGDVTIGTSGATIAGGLNAGTITSSGNMAVTGDLVATDLVLSDTNLTLAVGDTTSTGYVAVETLDLNGGMLLIDPDWNSNASFVVVTGANAADVIDVNGSIGVGRNSVGVFGTTAAEAETSLARLGLLNGGKLDQNGIGAALYLGDTLAVADQKHVLVDKTKDNNGLSTAISALNSSGSVTLESGSALVISESFTDTLVNDPSQAIFEFGATTGSVSVTAESGAQIIFDSADILGDDSVKVATVTGATASYDLNNADITAAGGLLKGEDINNDGTITFSLAQNAAAQLYNQSNPVRDMTLDVIGNANGAYDSSDAGVYYIGAMNAHNGGADIERTARMAVYAGAVQATLMAQQTSTDAVSERLGMANTNSALIASNNGQGGGLWLSPVYKNHDSDGFEAEGVNYGADIDLYGLALGADFTTESGVRVGAMFNVGSGDAEGQGIGESVSNDFDYYGFTLYAGVTFGNFALTADAGFTQVSNDLEQAVNYHGVGTLTADTDTQTVSVGVRGEYLFATPYVDIVPHVGLRYTNLDMDSYEARFNGYTVAATDVDNMSVFSIPFGVTFSKELSMGNWLVKPVFDLNLTANAGDDEIDTNTTFVGVESVALTSEVMDSFTYGASLGIDAQYQESISFGLNVGYTGSSNADEFGLNANARYVF